MTTAQESLSVVNNNCVKGSLDHRLVLYALAAGATLAWSAPSQAEVVFTPSNAVLQGLGKLDVDLDNDGATDFSILGRWTIYDTSNMIQALFAYGNRGSQQVATKFRDAAKFRKGEQIGPGQNFRAFALMETPFYRGYWNYKTESRCLGVRFLINGEVHFGWVGFRRVDAPKNVQLTLAGWAYETNPDMPITAGDIGSGPAMPPTSLQNLAAGHSGVTPHRTCSTSEGGRQ